MIIKLSPLEKGLLLTGLMFLAIAEISALIRKKSEKTINENFIIAELIVGVTVTTAAGMTVSRKFYRYNSYTDTEGRLPHSSAKKEETPGKKGS